MIIGDLALYGGIVGIILYICIMVIRHTTQLGRMTDVLRKYEERIAVLRSRREELLAQHRELSPQVDGLVKRVLHLRETRDRLQIQFQDMQAASRQRDIVIKTSSRNL